MILLLPSFHVINRFLEDSSVLATLAYLLSRGPLLPRLFLEKRRRRSQFLHALIFGFLGGSELIFPGDRYPYVTFTLAAAFSGYVGGYSVGILTCGVMTLLTILALMMGNTVTGLPQHAVSIVLSSLIGGTLANGRRLWERGRHRRKGQMGLFLCGVVTAGFIAEALDAFILLLSGRVNHTAFVKLFEYSATANGFGCLLLGIVLWDAHQRQQVNQKRIVAEQELANLRLSQLSELQARLHPHFLFNALAGIAGLCVINPPEAERGVTNLGNLLRQFLRSPTTVSVSLQEEMSTVHAYLSIERLRLEERLTITEDIPAEETSFQVPRFCLQVPVENAVQHGIAPLLGNGSITIRVRRHARHRTLAVTDTGVGYDTESRLSALKNRHVGEAPHGLELLALRLDLAYGTAAKMRVFSRTGRGTICVIRLPIEDSAA